MEVHIDQVWTTGHYRVWFFHRTGDGRIAYITHLANDQWSDEIVPEGGLAPEPTFTVPRQWMEALVKAISKLPSSDEATAVHLQDTREVRDRLLSMIEKRGLR